MGVAVTSRTEVFDLEPLDESYGYKPYLKDKSPNYKLFIKASNSKDANHCSGSSLL